MPRNQHKEKKILKHKILGITSIVIASFIFASVFPAPMEQENPEIKFRFFDGKVTSAISDAGEFTRFNNYKGLTIEKLVDDLKARNSSQVTYERTNSANEEYIVTMEGWNIIKNYPTLYAMQKETADVRIKWFTNRRS